MGIENLQVNIGNGGLLIIGFIISLIIIFTSLAFSKKITIEKYNKIAFKMLPIVYGLIGIILCVITHIYFVNNGAYKHMQVEKTDNMIGSSLYSQVEIVDDDSSYIIYNLKYNNVTSHNEYLIAFKADSIETIKNTIPESMEHYWIDNVVEIKDFTSYKVVNEYIDSIPYKDSKYYCETLMTQVKVYDIESYVDYIDYNYKLLMVFEFGLIMFIVQIVVIALISDIIVALIIRKLTLKRILNNKEN